MLNLIQPKWIPHACTRIKAICIMYVTCVANSRAATVLHLVTCTASILGAFYHGRGNDIG